MKSYCCPLDLEYRFPAAGRRRLEFRRQGAVSCRYRTVLETFGRGGVFPLTRPITF